MLGLQEDMLSWDGWVGMRSVGVWAGQYMNETATRGLLCSARIKLQGPKDVQRGKQFE